MVAVFDAMGTLCDLSALDERVEAAGAPATARREWFVRLLDSARVLTILGECRPFDELALTALRTTLAQHGADPRGAEGVVAALGAVPAHPDAGGALGKLRRAGVAVVLTNGGRRQTEGLLERAGLAGEIERVLSVEEVCAYKPDRRPYDHVAAALGAAPDSLALVAARGWDVLGARAAGWRALWVDRLEYVWPFPGAPPALRVPGLDDAAELLAAG